MAAPNATICRNCTALVGERSCRTITRKKSSDPIAAPIGASRKLKTNAKASKPQCRVRGAQAREHVAARIDEVADAGRLECSFELAAASRKSEMRAGRTQRCGGIDR